MYIRFALAFVALAFVTSIQAADKPQLAVQLFDKTVLPQANPIVDRMLTAFNRERKPPAEALKIYKETILEVLHHPQYRQAYISAYMQVFSEQELAQLVELAQHPAFAIYTRESANIAQLTYPAFLKINAAMKEKLEQRLKAANLLEWK